MIGKGKSTIFLNLLYFLIKIFYNQFMDNVPEMEYQKPEHQINHYKGKSYLAFWLGVLCIFILMVLMVASMIIGGGGSFEEGYQRGEAMGPVWGLFVIVSLLASLILSVVSIIFGGLAAKKDNKEYRTLAILGIIFGSIGLSLFLCCGVLIVLGIIAAASQGLT